MTADSAQRSGQQGGLTRTGAAGDQEGQPRGDDVVEQPSSLRRYRARGRQCRKILGRRPQYPQRQAGTAGRDRRQHGVQPNGVPSAEHVSQLCVDPWLGIIEPEPSSRGKALGQPAHGCFIGEADLTAVQPFSIIDPDVTRSRDQNIGGALGPQQWFEDAGTGKFGLEHAQMAENLGVAQHAAGLRPDGRGDDTGPQRYRFGS